MDQNLRDQISSIEAVLGEVQSIFRTDPLRWSSSLLAAQNMITELNNDPAALGALDLSQRVRILNTLQQLAYSDPESGGEMQIALWCERQWATLLQDRPDNLDALQGLGYAWLLKSKKILAQIYRDQSSSSSDGSHSSFFQARTIGPKSQPMDNARLNSSHYVEVRDQLRPSLSFLERAIAIAELQEQITGRLLELTAEAYLHFANVSHPSTNEETYQKALRCFQRASQVEGFHLEEHNQQLLEDNQAYM